MSIIFSLVTLITLMVFCFCFFVTFIWNAFCLVFSDLPGSVVWCLTLIWELLSHYGFKYFFCFFLSSTLVFPLHACYSFVVVSQSLNILGFFSGFFPSLLFCFGGFYGDILTLRDSFLSCVQSTNEPIRGLLHLCHSGFHREHFC